MYLGGGESEKFLRQKKFNVIDVLTVENDPDSIRKNLSRYENASDVIIILDSDRYWKKNREVFKEFDYPVQLFSIMQAYYLVMKPQLREVYDLLENDLSREIFTAALNVRFRIQPEEALFPFFDRNQYFALPQMCDMNMHEVFVDCGAFVGDTLEKFIDARIDHFDKIIAFEPSTKQRNALMIRRKRLLEEWAFDDSKIQVFPYGVGEENIETFIVNRTYQNNSSGREITDNRDRIDSKNSDVERIKIVKLDDFLKDEKVSFIKADIEGEEMSMLRGAANII